MALMAMSPTGSTLRSTDRQRRPREARSTVRGTGRGPRMGAGRSRWVAANPGASEETVVSLLCPVEFVSLILLDSSIPGSAAMLCCLRRPVSITGTRKCARLLDLVPDRSSSRVCDRSSAPTIVTALFSDQQQPPLRKCGSSGFLPPSRR
jgi:hypothetical protein